LANQWVATLAYGADFRQNRKAPNILCLNFKQMNSI